MSNVNNSLVAKRERLAALLKLPPEHRKPHYFVKCLKCGKSFVANRQLKNFFCWKCKEVEK